MKKKKKLIGNNFPMENVCSFPTKSVMEPIAGACEMFYEWVENPALSHSLISQRALQCEGLSALTHMWELPGLSSLRWEKGDGVHTMWFIEDKYGWGSCQFYSLVRAQRKCFLHIQEVRLGGEMRKVLAAEQGGKSPTARWAVEPRLINPAGSGLSLCDLPSFSGFGLCKKDRDKAVHCLTQKGLF